MSTPEPIVDNTNDDTDLDSFNDLFLGKTKEAPPEDDGPKDESAVEEVDGDAPIEQEETQTEDSDDDLVEDEKPAKLSPTQKRINQLLEKARLAEERAIAAEARLTERKEIEAPKPVAPTPIVKDEKAPHPDDKNADGTDKYPLGNFDEAYQEDRFNFRLEKTLEAQKAELAKQAQEQEIRQAQEALGREWNEKLEPAKERYPDFQEKGQALLDTFAAIPQEYGEYLTATIMSLDNGPDVLYYLSENIAEANRIVNLGGTKAAIALGRIDAKFEVEDVEEKPVPRPKVSKAPAPPPTNRGSSAALAEVPDDTDDLDAFTAKLFKKR